MVEAGLPPELAQGLFAAPGQHKVFMRLSTHAGDLLRDAISLPRGLALKVLNIEGERLPGAEGTTQDFVLADGKVFQAKNGEKFLGSLEAARHDHGPLGAHQKGDVERAPGVNSALETVGIESTTLASLGGAPNVDPLGETYYRVTPFRYGDYIAKFSVVPVAPALTALTGREIDATDHAETIRDTVQGEMRGIDGEWEFRVQLCRDLDRQPVEDPTVEWKEDEATFERVATIRVKSQDSWNEARVEAVNEAMRFGVWTGLAAHQPLGNVNRARNAAYRHSATFRQRFNACPIHEPT